MNKTARDTGILGTLVTMAWMLGCMIATVYTDNSQFVGLLIFGGFTLGVGTCVLVAIIDSD